MIRRLRLDGTLKANNKHYSCSVRMTIDTVVEDEWSDEKIDLSGYIDGTKITGELSFESPHLDGINHLIIKPGKAELTLRDGDDTTKTIIYLIENTKTEQVIPLRLRRYYWLFYAVDKPFWDKLEIFPKKYRGINMNKIYTCTNFRGFQSTQVSSIIIAESKQEAKNLLIDSLNKAKIFIEDENYFEFEEIDIFTKGAIILNDGN